jgi:hypothetical protein
MSETDMECHDFELIDRVIVEVEYADGTSARWAMLEGDRRIKKLEDLLGNPTTIKV